MAKVFILKLFSLFEKIVIICSVQGHLYSYLTRYFTNGVLFDLILTNILLPYPLLTVLSTFNGFSPDVGFDLDIELM